MKSTHRKLILALAAVGLVGAATYTTRRFTHHPKVDQCGTRSVVPYLYETSIEDLERSPLVVFGNFSSGIFNSGTLDVIEVLRGSEVPNNMPISVHLECNDDPGTISGRRVFILSGPSQATAWVSRYDTWLTPRRVRRVLAGDRTAKHFGDPTLPLNQWPDEAKRAACVVDASVLAEPDGLVGHFMGRGMVRAQVGSCPHHDDRIIVPEGVSWDLGTSSRRGTFALDPGSTPGTWIMRTDAFLVCPSRIAESECSDAQAGTV
jgi:hypothetical protein